MKKSLLLTMIATLLIAVMVLSACSTQGPVSESTEPSADAEQSETAEGAEEPAADGDIKIIGYNAYSDTVSFSKKITDNIMENAEKAGIKVLKADTNGDPTTAIKNADAFLSQGADLIIDSSWVVAATEAVAQKGKDAGIPVISIDIPVDDAYFMGVDNLEAGKVTGQAAIDYAKENWDGKIDYVFIAFTEASGEEVKKRCQGTVDIFREAGIEIPEENVIWVDPESSEGTAKTKQQATDFLTAHPEAEHIVMTSVNDQAALGMLSAVETSNRSDDVVIVSHGADEPALTNLRKEGNCWIGSTAYLPEKYGDVIFEMIEKLNAGEELPHETFTDTVFISKENIDEYYPE